MPQKIERIDIPKSFVTILRMTDKTGKEAQEIQVYAWEADTIETAIKNMTWNQINAFRDYEGTKIIKGSA